jgi:hypothetical protein
MQVEVVDSVVTILGHADVRQVSEAQVACSPHLAQLRLLPGGAELPIRPETFRAWQDVVEALCEPADLRPETACDVFEVR